MTSPSYQVDYYRFYDDDANEASATALGTGNNQALSMDEGSANRVQVRVEVYNNNNKAGVEAFSWEYNIDSAGWTTLDGSSTEIQVYASSYNTHDEDVTQRLTSNSTYDTTNAGCINSTSDAATSSNLDASVYAELVATIFLVSGQFTGGESVLLRVVEGGGDTVTMNVNPTINVNYPPVIVTPSSVTGVASSVNPTVVLGSISVTPTPASAIGRKVDPTIAFSRPVTGQLSTLSPAGVPMALRPEPPGEGDVTVEPAAVSAIASSVDPFLFSWFDGFESGDTSAWDSVQGTPTVSGAAALQGSYGLEAAQSAQDYAIKEWDNTTDQSYRVKFYTNFNTLSGEDGDLMGVALLRDGTGSCGYVGLVNNSGSNSIRISMRDDALAWSHGAHNNVSAGDHLVEAQWTYSDKQWAVDFNGTTTIINCGNGSAVDDLQDDAFTAEAWVKIDGGGENNAGRIFAKGDAGSGTGWWLRVSASGNNLEGYVQTDGAAGQSVRAFTGKFDGWVGDGKYHHVVMFWDDADERRVYLAMDGDWVDVYNIHNQATGAIESDVGDDLYIGNDSANLRTFDGEIAWARISNNDRYSHNTDFTPPSRVNPPATDGNTVEQWNFQDGSGTTLTAEVNSPTHDGTITNGSWVGHYNGHAELWIDGVFVNGLTDIDSGTWFPDEVQFGNVINTPTWTSGVAYLDHFTIYNEPNVIIAPSTANSVASSVDPTVVLGSTSVTPSATSAIASSVDPTVVLGDVVVTPSAVSTIANKVDPTVELGSTTATPTPVSGVASSIDPTTVLGSTTATPTPSSAITSKVDPVVVHGSISIAPSATSVISSSVAPTVILGSTTATPSAVGAIAVSIDPFVIGGGVTVAPSAISAVAGKVDPTVVLSSTTATPGPVHSIVSSVDPTVVYGSLTLSPSFGFAIADKVDPTVVYGSLSITPAPVSAVASSINPLDIFPAPINAIASTVNPTVIYGDVTVSPVPAGVVGSRASPTVVLGSTTATPTPVSAIASKVDPTVLEGAVVISPSPVNCVSSSINPTVVLGSITYTPAVVSSIATKVDPVVIYGSITYTPTPSSSIASSVDPTIINNVTLTPAEVTSIASTTGPTIFLGEQAYYPDSDSLVGQWLNEAGLATNLWQSIDETIPNDADYIKSPEDPGSAIYRATLEDAIDPNTDFGHKVKYRYRKDPDIDTVNVKVRLKQGAATIAEWTHTDVSATWTDGEQTLTGVQADSITDYSDLLVEVEAY